MQTLFTGKPTVQLNQVNSTNTYLKELCENQSINEGYAVTAVEQTKGSGQRGKVWHSPAGENLLCSIYFKPRFLTPEKAYLLNMVCATAITQWLAEESISSRIKWPNDVYIGNRKCAGILIENRIKSSVIAHSIIGLGINLNQTLFYGNDLENATSAALTKNKKFNIEKVFSRYCELLESNYLTAKSNPKKLVSNFNQQLWGTEEYQNYQNQEGETLRLKTLGVSARGFLKARTEEGNQLVFNQNELKLLHY